jgi:hypothetical protein
LLTNSNVNSGTSRTFRAGDGCICGPNCTAQDLPESEIGAIIQLWEHDEGNVDTAKSFASTGFAVAAAILAATGVGSAVLAAVAAVGGLLQWFISLMDDDHIADQTLVFTRQVVENQLGKTGHSIDMTRQFTDGDGDYILTIALSRFP